MFVNIEAERARRQLNRAALSRALQISAQSYTAYVKELRPIPSDVLIRMAELFGCSVDYLLSRPLD